MEIVMADSPQEKLINMWTKWVMGQKQKIQYGANEYMRGQILKILAGHMINHHMVAAAPHHMVAAATMW